MKTYSKTVQGNSEKSDSTLLTKFLVILGVFGVTTFVTYGAVNTPDNAFMSSPYTTRSSTGDLALSNATNGQGAAILDVYVARILSGATAQGSVPAYNAYLTQKLAALDALDSSLQAEKDANGKLIYDKDYTFIFSYIYPRVHEKLKLDQTNSIFDQIGDVIDTVTGPVAPSVPTVSTGITTSTFTVSWTRLPNLDYYNASTPAGKNAGGAINQGSSWAIPLAADANYNTEVFIRACNAGTTTCSDWKTVAIKRNGSPLPPPPTPVASAPDMPTISTESTNTNFTIFWTRLPNIDYYNASTQAEKLTGGSINTASIWTIPLPAFGTPPTDIYVRACNAGTTFCSDWKTVRMNVTTPYTASVDCLTNSNGLTIATGKSCVASSNVTQVFGSNGVEAVTVTNTNPLLVDQNVEAINFPSAKDEYVAKQAGNRIVITHKNNPNAPVQITVRANGSSINFGGTTLVATLISGEGMKIGNQVVGSSDATVTGVVGQITQQGTTLDEPTQVANQGYPVFAGTTNVPFVYVDVKKMENGNVVAVAGTGRIPVISGRFSSTIASTLPPLGDGAYIINVRDASNDALLTTGTLTVQH